MWIDESNQELKLGVIKMYMIQVAAGHILRPSCKMTHLFILLCFIEYWRLGAPFRKNWIILVISNAIEAGKWSFGAIRGGAGRLVHDNLILGAGWGRERGRISCPDHGGGAGSGIITLWVMVFGFGAVYGVWVFGVWLEEASLWSGVQLGNGGLMRERAAEMRERE